MVLPLTKSDLIKLIFFVTQQYCYFSQANANYSIVSNVPQYHPELPKVIQFSVTRRKEDGALKKDLLLLLKSIFDIDIFIESGTYLGGTALQAAGIFDQVHTIELSPHYHNKAVAVLRDLKNVFTYQGDSAEVFAQILKGFDSRILFYLDGHNSGGDTARGSTNTPILRELACIRNANKTDAIILIDDIRLFQQAYHLEKIRNTHLEGYPDLTQLIDALLDINPNYQICFLGDALLAYPQNDSIGVSQVMNACAIHRIASAFPHFSESALQQADAHIANADRVERQQLISYYTTYARWEIEMGLRSFSTLWYGLTVYQEGKLETARTLFQQAAENSLPGWRANEIIQRESTGSLFRQTND